MSDEQCSNRSQRKTDRKRLAGELAKRIRSAGGECQQQQTGHGEQDDEIYTRTVKPCSGKTSQQQRECPNRGSARRYASSGLKLRFRCDDCVAWGRKTGADGVTRTLDLLFTKQLLYQLSYVGEGADFKPVSADVQTPVDPLRNELRHESAPGTVRYGQTVFSGSWRQSVVPSGLAAVTR